MKRIAVLAGSAAEARQWLHSKMAGVGGTFDSVRLVVRLQDGTTEWRYVGTANAARGVDWTGMELVGTWGIRTDPQAHEIWTAVFDRTQQTKAVAG